MFGCSKVYECSMYSDYYCSSYVGYLKFKAYTQDNAESSCLGYVYDMGFDTTFTIYPECCNCDNYELAIFGSDYVN